MRAHILGSSAGGGLPQWSCSCRNCKAARRGDPRVWSRTQDSLAVFARDDAAVLCNPSPDLARQLAATPALHPRERHGTPIAAVVLTSGELERVLGLLALCERPLAVYSTDAVRRAIVAHQLPAHVAWRQLELDREVEVAGVVIKPFAVPGRLPAAEANIGVSLACARTRTTIVYAPHCANAPAHLGDGADALLFDGTFWSNDELLSQELADVRAVDLAHLPVGGLHGSLVQLAKCSAKRKIFTHVSHTNPMLRHDSRERLAAASAGWEIAEDDTILSWGNLA